MCEKILLTTMLTIKILFTINFNNNYNYNNINNNNNLYLSIRTISNIYNMYKRGHGT